MKQFLPAVKAAILRVVDFLYPSYLFKVNPRKIVAASFRGTGYSGNAALVLNELIKQDPTVDAVWLALDVNTKVPAGVRVVKYNSLASYYELATAHIWIDDFRKKYFPRKKSGQIYYQTWHGVLPLKKVEADAESRLDPMYVREAKRDGAISDFMVAGNTFTASVYKRAFWFDGEVLPYGTPSLDALLQPAKSFDPGQMKAKIGLGVKEKVVLYCPTFREQFRVSDYTLASRRLLTRLSEQLGGKWRLLIRLHPNARRYANEVITANPGSIDVTGYPDLTDLILAADIIVSDFSSVMFNALYADKPVFIFAQDYKDYISNERGVYSIVNKLPFSVSQSTDELLLNVAKFDFVAYQSHRDDFLELIGSSESGHSASELANHILARIDN